jgi:hypothetical protein
MWRRDEYANAILNDGDVNRNAAQPFSVGLEVRRGA